MNFQKLKGFIFVTLLILIGTGRVFAVDLSWHEESENYQVYLGIVPADAIKNVPSLVDNDKSLHGGVKKLPSGAQHVMVTVFRKDGKTRVLNATVIAEVSSGILLGRKKLEKPLEKMSTSGAINYANFFNMPGKGKYKIEVKIYESDKNGSDEVTFFNQRE